MSNAKTELIKKFDANYYIIKNILETEPATRNSDPYLAFKYYQKTISNFRPSVGNPMTVNDFFEKLHNKDITAMSTITRTKRQVLESCPQLRGTNYKARQKTSKTVRKFIIGKKSDYRMIESARRTINGASQVWYNRDL